MSEQQARARAETALRDSYGRLLAMLASRTRDIIEAEDALADAFQRALETWPEKGVPERPEAWLFTVARNRLRDGRKSAGSRLREAFDDHVEFYESQEPEAPEEIPDDRLRMMFVCAHPSIDPEIHAPLMLQTILGLEATQVARVFLVKPATMAQRLVRAKRRIKEAGLEFQVPEGDERAPRVQAVLEAIYGAHAVGWVADIERGEVEDLGTEARFLASLVAELMPDDPEALGLAALTSFSHARRAARLTDTQQFVPLSLQDVALWDTEEMDHAEATLVRAHGLGSVGRFQLEAAIEAVHCERRNTGKTEWMALAQLYEGVFRLAPTMGAAVGRAVAVGLAVSADEGLLCLDAIDEKIRKTFQPAWVARAFLLAAADRGAEAIAAYKEAIHLTTRAPERRYLRACLAELE